MSDEPEETWVFAFADAVAKKTLARLFNSHVPTDIQQLVSDAVRSAVLEALHEAPITGNGDDRL